jgi:hypothetical protein
VKYLSTEKLIKDLIEPYAALVDLGIERRNKQVRLAEPEPP